MPPTASSTGRILCWYGAWISGKEATRNAAQVQEVVACQEYKVVAVTALSAEEDLRVLEYVAWSSGTKAPQNADQGHGVVIHQEHEVIAVLAPSTEEERRILCWHVAWISGMEAPRNATQARGCCLSGVQSRRSTGA